MGFDDPVKFHPSWAKIKQGDHEFLWQVGDRLTMIPITPPKNYSLLRRLWLRYAPEFWKRHKRHKSHLKFLDKVGVTDKDGRKYFGTDGHIATEKIRVTRLPLIEYNEFDCRKRTSRERSASLRALIRRAIDEHKR